ncbi:unnamed protein product [Paramecium pentaurelia]|uniref:Protein kinase domain-containing protein n=1 Tax=Paramecium pentaurelia TaxID=43138 RepID=A0A8S1U7D9_9CILI|nr:unnamed protein product [Paramecium pentaurelia]
MKKTITLPSDYSKSSFFNDGKELFCNSPQFQMEFTLFGTFLMKSNNRQYNVNIFLHEFIMKIIEEKGERHINLENVCVKKALHSKTQQLGLRISKNGQFIEFFGEIIELWKQIKKFVIQTDFSLKYKLGQKLGERFSSSVFKALKIINGQKVAVKIIEKSLVQRNNASERQQLINELTVLRQINHDNLLKLHETFESDEKIYLVLDLLEGGHLKNSIFRFRYSEQETIILMQTLFKSLNYMHEKNIYHQDIRFDNILLKDQQDLTSACIINFGKSEIIQQSLVSTQNLNFYDQNSLIQFIRKKDILSLCIVIYSIFSKKLYQETQILDELLMKNYESMSDIEYLDLNPPLLQFFEIFFTSKGKTQMDTIKCSDILNLDIFNLPLIRRPSKFQGIPQQINHNFKRASRFAPKYSEKEQQIISNFQKILKLPTISDSSESKISQNHSQSPQTENFISYRLLQDEKASSIKPRYSVLKKCLSPNI